MKFIYFLLFTFFAVSTNAQYDTRNFSKIKISLENKNITDLVKLGLEIDHGVIRLGKYIINDFSETEMQQITNAGFDFEILIADVKEFYRNQNRDFSLKSVNQECNNTSNTEIPVYETPENYTYGSMGGYLTYAEMLVVLDSMVSKFPHLISSKNNIGTAADTTWKGNRIFWMKISDNPNVDEAEPEVLFTSLHHAREPNSLSQNIFYMWYLLENYDKDPEIAYLVNETEIYFIPCVNPDGYILNGLNDPNGGGMIRKNARDNNNNGTYQASQDGVDLNRNYGYQWAFDNAGSSSTPSNETYRGPSAFSEPETRMVKKFCDSRQIQITLNYHTYGNLLIHPWGYSDMLTSEHATFSVFGKEMTQYNNYTFGTGSMTVGYETNGDSDDWMYGETVSKGKIYSLTPEAGDESAGFWPASSSIDKYNKANMHQNLSASRLVLNYVEAEEVNPNDWINSSTGNFEFQFFKKGLLAGDVTVNFSSLNTNLILNFNPQIISLAHLGTQNISVPFSVNSTTQNGDELSFVVSIDNGLHTYFDTIKKTYSKGNIVTLFEDDNATLTNWVGSGWSLTSSSFYSPSTSITESPFGNYSNNKSSKITTKNPIDLSNVDNAFVEFYAKWEIENDYDFTQFLISTDNGASYTPLCGKYTNDGTINQVVNTPLYDNVQADWVKEIIDISEFVGGEVLLQFHFKSDQGVRADGFYFDDFKVKSFQINDEEEEVTSILDLSRIEFRVFPNPANQVLNIEIKDFATENSFEITDILGQEVLKFSLFSKKNIVDISSLSKGIYFIKMANDKNFTSIKFIIE